MVQLHEGRIWIDGCFDFAHHGHAGAMMQAREKGDELYVGVHNDEDILVNKGPPVMTLAERMAAVEGCRWCTKAVANAPYVTDPAVMDEYGCKYVVHGDDITTDKDGKDCYAEVKAKGRFLVVKRTPNISTTDLVGRMLVNTTGHHLARVNGEEWTRYVKGETAGEDDKKTLLAPSNVERYTRYATAADARSSGDYVWVYTGDGVHELVSGSAASSKQKKPILYVDGGFDLFHPGHITFLKRVRELADENGSLVVVGIADDAAVNRAKGRSFPVMNLHERSLCVLQSKYVDGIVLGAPTLVDETFLSLFEPATGHSVKHVVHGPTPYRHEADYAYPRSVGLLLEVPADQNPYANMTVESIVDRVVANRAAFEERQRRKGVKAQTEQALLLGEKEADPASV